MATNKNKTLPPVSEPTKLIVGKDAFKVSLNERIKVGEEIYNKQIQTNLQLEDAKLDFNNWNDYNSELLKQSFNNENNEYRKDYNTVNLYYSLERSQGPLVDFKGKLHNKITELKQLLQKVDLIKSNIVEPSKIIGKSGNQSSEINNNVFIVHGHNTEIKLNVARTLEKLGLSPIILHEQPDDGKTVIEKIEEYSDVGFAIILLTDDDIGKSKLEETLNPRARQNVILELGYFIGKLGRKNVCTLYAKGVEIPSDLRGLLYTEIDSSESWKFKIARELKSAGYDIDANNIV
jgi:predicted nucleotide-binding protein